MKLDTYLYIPFTAPQAARAFDASSAVDCAALETQAHPPPWLVLALDFVSSPRALTHFVLLQPSSKARGWGGGGSIAKARWCMTRGRDRVC